MGASLVEVPLCTTDNGFLWVVRIVDLIPYNFTTGFIVFFQFIFSSRLATVWKKDVEDLVEWVRKGLVCCLDECRNVLLCCDFNDVRHCE